MHPFFHILGHSIPAYGVMMVVAAVISYAAIVAFSKCADYPGFDAQMLFLIALPGVIIGSVALRPVMKIIPVVIGWDKYKDMTADALLHYVFSEVVFYGGLIGGFLCILWYCIRFKLPVVKTLDFLAPIVPISHAVGRVGCLLAGCCYGVEAAQGSLFAIVYPSESLAAPPGVPLVAVPIIESAALLIISASTFAVFLLVKKRGWKKGLAVCTYIILYSAERFILEFYRGDISRGIYRSFSTSQYISVAFFVTAISYLLYAVITTGVFRKAKSGR